MAQPSLAEHLVESVPNVSEGRRLEVVELPLLEPLVVVSRLRVSGSTDFASLSVAVLVLVSFFGSLTVLESLQAEQMRSANSGRIEKCLIMASPFWIPAKS